MKLFRVIVYSMLVIFFLIGIDFEVDKMQAEIERMQWETEELKQISPINQTQLDSMQAKSLELSQRGYELETLRKWLITPEEDGFVEVTNTFKTLGYENSKDQLFRRYIENQVLDNYLEYISGDGVQKYKHSYLADKMTSTNNDWWDKALYNSVDGENIPTTNVVIPEELLTFKRRLSNFLDDMGHVFIEK